MFVLSFSISFVYLGVILLILCVIPLWDSATAHSPSGKEIETLPLRKMPVFQAVAPRHKIFTSSCIIPLWDSATAHLPSGKELNPSSQEDARCSGRCTSAYNFHFILRKTAAIRNILFYIWSISIAKDRRYRKYFILCVVYFYSKRPPLSKIFHFMCGLFL